MIHSKIGASSSHRWMACPGSVALCEQMPPEKPKDYAEEGTAAHTLAELCLLENKNAEEYRGQKMQAKQSEWEVNDEMIEGVQEYLDEVRSLINSEVTEGIEAKFDLSWLHPGMFGTNDCFVYNPSSKRLTVLDFKYGKGVAVEPEWNSQMMFYALGALQKIAAGGDVFAVVDMIELVIVQPRAYHSEGSIRRWAISAEDLMFWGLNVLKPAAIATEQKNAPLCVGEYCRFCPARTICPEMVRHACAVAKTDFNEIRLPDPSEFTPEDIAKVMLLAEVITDWSKEVKLYAQNQMEVGVQVPGYKLVKKRGKREWVNEAVAEQKLVEIVGEEAYEKKLLTFPKAETLLKKKGLSSEAYLNGLWDKLDTGNTIASLSDKRPAVVPPAAVDFLDGAEFLK